MKHKIDEAKPLVLKEGYMSDQHYDDYSDMTKSFINWKHQCTYKLSRDGLSGHHQILQLQNMQIAYAKRIGGVMHKSISAKDCFTVAVVKSLQDKICFGNLKLKVNDILFFDDSHSNIFIANDDIEFIAINIQKKSLGFEGDLLREALDCSVPDTSISFATMLRDIWKECRESDKKIDYLQIEKKILSYIVEILTQETPRQPKLTKGEKIALSIRDKVFHHMDAKIDIKSLANEYDVSEQTLQNSFKSLFGFTPQYFLRLLKLNNVRQELKTSDYHEAKVSKIANRWGFAHMGRFSAYYKELFGENPSETLKNAQINAKYIATDCVTRKEEVS